MTPDAYAYRSLTGYLEQLEDNGRRIPCRDARPDVRAMWTSGDPEDQDQAATRCVGCPAVRECDAYGLAYPREVGVYGGRTERDRKQRRDASA